MAILLFCVGALTFAVGGAMIGFGIPINEFSFGNTLIGAGVTAAVGGLIVIGLGMVVHKLQQIANDLAPAESVYPARPTELHEMAGIASSAPARVPFPARPKPGVRPPPAVEPVPAAPVAAQPAEPAATQSFAPSFAPTLRNPDEAPPPIEETVEEEEVSLTPPQPVPMAPPGIPEVEKPVERGPTAVEPESEIAPPGPVVSREAELRPPPFPPPERPKTDFDMMWPPKGGAPKAPAKAAGPEPEKPPPPVQPTEAEPPKAAEAPASAPQPAVLKSGVVDGMAYTLYVDGSIEAEMPQGTLRFASINELREYLESNG